MRKLLVPMLVIAFIGFLISASLRHKEVFANIRPIEEAPSPIPVPHQIKHAEPLASQSVEQIAKANAAKFLDGTLGKGRYEVLDSYFDEVDPEVENVAYPLRLFMVVRFKDPFGYLKRPLTFAVFKNGAIYPLTDPSTLYRN